MHAYLIEMDENAVISIFILNLTESMVQKCVTCTFDSPIRRVPCLKLCFDFNIQ